MKEFVMQRKIIIEGTLTEISLNNLGSLETLDYDVDALNDEAEIEEFMQEVQTLVESGDVDILGDVCKYRVMPSEAFDYLACSDEQSEEQEISLESFKLCNKSLDEVEEFLDAANVGDIIYLRKEEGKGSYEFSLEVQNKEEKIRIDYFDCSESFDAYDVLRESYLDTLCDTLLPETIASQEQKAVVENSLFEPQIVFGEIYRVIDVDGIKTLDRVAIPAYYYKNETETIDEI
jgi:hypothetical protein